MSLIMMEAPNLDAESVEFQSKLRLIREFVRFFFTASKLSADIKSAVISRIHAPGVLLFWVLNSLMQMGEKFWLKI